MAAQFEFSIKHTFVRASREILVFKEVRSSYLIFRYSARKKDRRKVIKRLVHFIRSFRSPVSTILLLHLFEKRKLSLI